MHKYRFFIVSHLSSNECNIHAYFRNNKYINALLILFFILNLIDENQGGFKIFERPAKIIDLKVAVSQQVTNVDKEHRVLVDNFVLDGLLCIFKLVNGGRNISNHHNALSIPRLDPYVVINSELRVAGRQQGIVDFPPIVDFLDQVKHPCSLFKLFAFHQGIA